MGYPKFMYAQFFLQRDPIVNHRTGCWVLDTSQDSFGKCKLGGPHTLGLSRAAHGEIPQTRTSTR
jgi:hypothetical protein